MSAYDVPEQELSLRERNKLQSRKLLEEAMAGTAAASGMATPAQQQTASGMLGGSPTVSPFPGLSGLITPPTAGPKNINSDLMRAVSNRQPRIKTDAGGVEGEAIARGEVPGEKKGSGGNIDTFMSAISDLESGGDPNLVNKSSGAHGQFQIMPSNWKPWAQETGLGADAPKTQENQNLVARHKMNEYYKRFGDWGAVAVAWFAGPDRARRYMEGDTSVLNMDDGNTTVRDYVNRIERNM